MFDIENPFRHYGCRVNDKITWDNNKALLIQNELLEIVLLVDKGAEIVQFLYKPLDIDFLWHSENRLKYPGKFVPNGGGGTTSFFDHWSGAWFEVLPNGGPDSFYKGVELGQFAETINIPWEYKIIKDTPEEIKIALWVRTYRTPFLLKKVLTLKSNIPALFIEEEVVNTGKETLEFMWGHHPVVGAPFLDENCSLCAPPCNVEVLHAEDGPDNRIGLHQEGKWPFLKDINDELMNLSIIPGPENRSMDNFYLKDFSEGWIAINRKDVGFGLAWDPAVFKYIWVWQALGGGIGYPWYGRTYNIGIEPWTSYPCAGLNAACANGSAVSLKAGEKRNAWLTAVAFTGRNEVNGILRSGVVL